MVSRHQECPDCGGTDFVESHSSGDTVCTSCGLVVAAHTIDSGTEWRTFADNDKNTGDPSRVGAAVNSLLDNGTAATTRIDMGKSSGGWSNLERQHARANNSDRALLSAFGAISQMCERLGLKDNVKGRSHELFKQIYDMDPQSVRTKPNAATASCVFIACKQVGYPRTFNEIVPVANAKKKDIGKLYKLIVAKLGVTDMQVIHASDYMRRFCNQLAMSMQDTKAAIELVNNASPKDGREVSNKNAWDGKSPISVAAACIYIISLLPKASVAPSLTDISTVSRVAEATIRTTYRDIFPARHTLVPSWFASAADLDNLPVPVQKGTDAAKS